MQRRGEVSAILLFLLAAAACGAPTVSSLGADGSSPTPAGSSAPTPAASGTPVGASGPLRLMAANLSTGTQQSWDPGEGMRILEGFKPDVVLLQEFNYKTNSAADVRSFVDAVCGTECSVARESGAQIPNGIISRYPILDSGTWTDPQVSNRGFEWARIDVPGGVDLYAVSVHLLTTNASDRNAEAQALVSKIQAMLPAGAFLALGGDFNTGTRTEACLTTLAAELQTAGPFPADRNGNDNTSENRSAPHDWVLVNAALAAHETATTIGANTFAHGTVADTRVYTPVTDIAPALAGDSGASGMQHMGVVRDFGL